MISGLKVLDPQTAEPGAVLCSLFKSAVNKVENADDLPLWLPRLGDLLSAMSNESFDQSLVGRAMSECFEELLDAIASMRREVAEKYAESLFRIHAKILDILLANYPENHLVSLRLLGKLLDTKSFRYDRVKRNLKFDPYARLRSYFAGGDLVLFSSVPVIGDPTTFFPRGQSVSRVVTIPPKDKDTSLAFLVVMDRLFRADVFSMFTSFMSKLTSEARDYELKGGNSLDGQVRENARKFEILDKIFLMTRVLEPLFGYVDESFAGTNFFPFFKNGLAKFLLSVYKNPVFAPTLEEEPEYMARLYKRIYLIFIHHFGREETCEYLDELFIKDAFENSLSGNVENRERRLLSIRFLLKIYELNKDAASTKSVRNNRTSAIIKSLRRTELASIELEKNDPVTFPVFAPLLSLYVTKSGVTTKDLAAVISHLAPDGKVATDLDPDARAQLLSLLKDFTPHIDEKGAKFLSARLLEIGRHGSSEEYMEIVETVLLYAPIGHDVHTDIPEIMCGLAVRAFFLFEGTDQVTRALDTVSQFLSEGVVFGEFLSLAADYLKKHKHQAEVSRLLSRVCVNYQSWTRSLEKRFHLISLAVADIGWYHKESKKMATADEYEEESFVVEKSRDDINDVRFLNPRISHYSEWSTRFRLLTTLCAQSGVGITSETLETFWEMFVVASKYWQEMEMFFDFLRSLVRNKLSSRDVILNYFQTHVLPLDEHLGTSESYYRLVSEFFESVNIRNKSIRKNEGGMAYIYNLDDVQYLHYFWGFILRPNSSYPQDYLTQLYFGAPVDDDRPEEEIYEALMLTVWKLLRRRDETYIRPISRILTNGLDIYDSLRLEVRDPKLFSLREALRRRRILVRYTVMYLEADDDVYSIISQKTVSKTGYFQERALLSRVVELIKRELELDEQIELKMYTDSGEISKNAQHQTELWRISAKDGTLNLTLVEEGMEQSVYDEIMDEYIDQESPDFEEYIKEYKRVEKIEKKDSKARTRELERIIKIKKKRENYRVPAAIISSTSRLTDMLLEILSSNEYLEETKDAVYDLIQRIPVIPSAIAPLQQIYLTPRLETVLDVETPTSLNFWLDYITYALRHQDREPEVTQFKEYINKAWAREFIKKNGIIIILNGLFRYKIEMEHQTLFSKGVDLILSMVVEETQPEFFKNINKNSSLYYVTVVKRCFTDLFKDKTIQFVRSALDLLDLIFRDEKFVSGIKKKKLEKLQFEKFVKHVFISHHGDPALEKGLTILRKVFDDEQNMNKISAVFIGLLPKATEKNEVYFRALADFVRDASDGLSALMDSVLKELLSGQLFDGGDSVNYRLLGLLRLVSILLDKGFSVDDKDFSLRIYRDMLAEYDPGKNRPFCKHSETRAAASDLVERTFDDAGEFIRYTLDSCRGLVPSDRWRIPSTFRGNQAIAVLETGAEAVGHIIYQLYSVPDIRKRVLEHPVSGGDSFLSIQRAFYFLHLSTGVHQVPIDPLGENFKYTLDGITEVLQAELGVEETYFRLKKKTKMECSKGHVTKKVNTLSMLSTRNCDSNSLLEHIDSFFRVGDSGFCQVCGSTVKGHIYDYLSDHLPSFVVIEIRPRRRRTRNRCLHTPRLLHLHKYTASGLRQTRVSNEPYELSGFVQNNPGGGYTSFFLRDRDWYKYDGRSLSAVDKVPLNFDGYAFYRSTGRAEEISLQDSLRDSVIQESHNAVRLNLLYDKYNVRLLQLDKTEDTDSNFCLGLDLFDFLAHCDMESVVVSSAKVLLERLRTKERYSCLLKHAKTFAAMLISPPFTSVAAHVLELSKGMILENISSERGEDLKGSALADFVAELVSSLAAPRGNSVRGQLACLGVFLREFEERNWMLKNGYLDLLVKHGETLLSMDRIVDGVDLLIPVYQQLLENVEILDDGEQRFAPEFELFYSEFKMKFSGVFRRLFRHAPGPKSLSALILSIRAKSNRASRHVVKIAIESLLESDKMHVLMEFLKSMDDDIQDYAYGEFLRLCSPSAAKTVLEVIRTEKTAIPPKWDPSSLVEELERISAGVITVNAPEDSD